MLNVLKKLLMRPVNGHKTQGGDPMYCLLAEFDSPAALYHAAEKVRDAGYTKWDVFSPTPIHGMDDAMGLRPSKIGFITAGAAMAGFSASILLQWFTNAFNYPINIASKPLFAWEQAIPVTFELTVLFAGVSTIIGVILMSGLPRLHHPLFGSRRFLRASDDGFFVAIEAGDPKFDPAGVKALFKDAGSTGIEEVANT